ncbi:lipopolysaccharide biosynthesis protein [Stappia stellulata]|uniref:lipopolysaccharide biosynthesis protein n=1 Tax=Stappia stellulata TaxID=71235 RepID=UPI0003F7E735|nr:lipopolysaccharide biosynthesis protein [Stappia stellulata]
MKRLLALAARGNIKRLFWSLFSRFGSTVLSFAALFGASHALDTAEYGLYIFLFSVGTSLGLIFVLGQPVLLVKHFRLKDHVPGETNQALLRVNALWLGFGIGIQLLAAMSVWIFSARLSAPYDSLPIAFLFGAVFTVSEYLQNYFRIHGRIVMALVPRENLWRLLTAVTLPALAYAGLLVSGAAATEIVTGLLVLTVGFQAISFVKHEGLAFLSRRAARGQVVPWRRWNAETLNFSANGFFNAASSYLETILIGIAIGLEVAAFYFVAYRIAMLLTLPVLAIDTVGIPLISAKFQENDRPGAQKLVAMLSAGSFALAAIGGVMLYFLGPFILHLFDPAFVEHFDVLVLLSLAAISHAFFGPGTWLTMIGGGESYLLRMRSIVFVVYLGLLYVLGRQFGLDGVAIAGWAQLVIVHLLSRRWVMRTWQVDNMATAILGIWRNRGGGDGGNAPGLKVGGEGSHARS